MSRKSPRSFTGDVGVNILFAIVPVAVTFISVPIYLSLIGLERYGILTLVWALTGMFAFFDLGMGAATNYLVARARGGADGPAAGSVILTNALVNFILGWLFASIFWLWVGPLVFGNIKGSPELNLEIEIAIGWIALLLPVGLVSSIFRNALDGQRRFLAGNIIGVGGQVGTVLCAIAVATLIGPELVNLVISVLLVRLVVLFLFVASCFATLKDSSLMNMTEFRRVVKFGGWQTLFSGLSGILGSADRFILGWIVGAAATALYAIPNSLTSRLRVLPQAILRTLYPRLSEAIDDNNRQALGARAFVGTMALMAAITVPAILLVRPFFGLWLGSEFESTAGLLAQMLLLVLFLQSCMRVLVVLQRASGRPDIAAKLRLVTIVPGVILIILMTWWIGAVGTALALAVRIAAEVCWMLYVSNMFASQFTKLIILFGTCLLAIAISFLDFGLVPLMGLTVIAFLGLLTAAGWLSPDIARYLGRVRTKRSHRN